MRIAVSGAHGTGKSTLVADLADALSGHLACDEPWYHLEGEGVLFADPPTLGDFEAQLDRSLRLIRESDADTVFDRCPADFLAYLSCHRHADRFDPEPWLSPIRDAMARLDLVVFTPVETPDRIDVPASEGRALRHDVDEALRDLLLEDRIGFGGAVIEVTGSPRERVNRVMTFLGR